MNAKTGLLVLTNPGQIKKILPTITQQIKNTLYIHLTSALSDPLTRYKPDIFTSAPKYSKTIRGIYAEAEQLCENLDIRVLLSGLKYSQVHSLQTLNTIETIIFDRNHEKDQIDTFINNCVKNKRPDCNIYFIKNEELVLDEEKVDLDSTKTYKHVVLGGTFDRIHTGHKILLTEAVLCATEKLTVGVTDDKMITSKTLWELIQPCEKRIADVKQFLNDICPELNYNVVPIEDPFGPTKSDPTMELIVVSAETLRGGEKVNEIRKQNNLSPLEIKTIDLIDCCNPQEKEEIKISSSTNRIRMLGTLLKPPNKLPKTEPYIIGLTGGIASGKSAISSRLSALGAAVIDCDKVAHELYQPGKPCYNLIREAFGDKIIAENGEINRKVLGAIVFTDKNELERLNSLVWPAIAEEVQKRINNLHIQNNKIIVIEAAVLLKAGWDKLCHEIWTCIIPPKEAVERLRNRNGLTESDAQARLNSQPSTVEHVTPAHVVLYTYWEPDYTQILVERAWKQLNQRLPWKQKEN